MSLLNKIRVYGSFVEQPQIIRVVGQKAGWIGGLGGVGLLAGADAYHAKPEERQKVLTRDAMVLGSTALGTWAAARKFMALPTEKEAKATVERYIDEVQETLGKFKNSSPSYQELAKDLEKLKAEGRSRLGLNDFRNIIEKIEKNSNKAEVKDHLAKIFEPEEGFPGWTNMFKEMWQKGSHLEGKEEGEIRKMLNFFVVGGLSVLSGLFGGIAANKINKVQDKDATVNMVKEGVFQFIANIALCAVGAAAAIVGMAPLQSKFAKMGWAGKGIKTVGIGAGLSLGIFGGGVIANKLGTKVINPLCDKIQGKEPQPQSQTDPNQGKRKIEFWDAILHLDDVPTALALAGLEIVEPFIPLFFGFSGYRTGIGYRNDDATKAGKGNAQPAQAPSFAAQPESSQSEPTSQAQASPVAEPWSAQSNPFKPAMPQPWDFSPMLQQQAMAAAQPMPSAAPAA